MISIHTWVNKTEKARQQRFLLLLLSFLAVSTLHAQSFERTFAITGATAHLGNGEVVENAVIFVRDGIIERVHSDANPPIPKLYRQIEADGKHVYPGLIAAGSTVGLVEIDAVRPTRDYEEVGDFNSHIRSLIAFNTDSEIIPTLRFNGVLTAQSRPMGGKISGTSSIFNLDGWNWEDAVLVEDDAMWLNWPRKYYQTGWWAEPGTIKENENYKEEVRSFTSFFEAALKYDGKPLNLRLKAMKKVLDGKTKLFITAQGAQEIIEAVEFAKQYGITPVINGAQQAWMIPDFLKENNIPVIVEGVHVLPEFAESDYDQPYKQLDQLMEAGVLCALSRGAGWGGSWQQRNLTFMAGTVAAYSEHISKEQALMLLTGNMAKILGVDHFLGTIEEGKHANLIIASDDILEIKSATIEAVFIRGKSIGLTGRQQLLYKKYRDKYIDAGLIKP